MLDEQVHAKANAHTVELLCVPDVRNTFQLNSMHIRRVEKKWMFPEHVHDDLFELSLVLDGCHKVTIEGETYWQKPNELLLIAPGQWHISEVGDTPKLSMFCLHFNVDDDIFVHLLHKYMSTRIFDEQSRIALRIRDILEKMIILAHRAHSLTVQHRMKIQATAFELFFAISQCLVDDEDTSSDPVNTNMADPINVQLIAQRIANRIEHAMSKEIDSQEPELQQIKHIAKELHITPEYCNRVFQRIYGTSPRRYLSKMKLHRAQELLVDTDMGIQEIALALGYREMSQFSRQFKRWTGMSPSKYRMKHSSTWEDYQMR